jgi:hypothetical protein
MEKLRTALTTKDDSTVLTLSKQKQQVRPLPLTIIPNFSQVSIAIRLPVSSRVHLSWTFTFTPHGNLSDIVTPLARTGLYYHSLSTHLLSIISQKDVHIQSLQEKLKDLGGTYFPRKHKDALEEFNVDKWWEGERKVAREGEESGWEVFERWGLLGVEEGKDWEAVVSGLGGWLSGEKVWMMGMCG